MVMTRTVGGMATVGLVVVLAVGCASDGSTTGNGAAKPGAETQQVIALRSELVYTRTGGIMGLGERVVIQPDGGLEASGKVLGPHSGRLSTVQTAELAGLLQDWPALQVDGRTPQGAADYFVLSITYAGKTLKWTSVTPQVPDELTRLAQRIEELAKSVK